MRNKTTRGGLIMAKNVLLVISAGVTIVELVVLKKLRDAVIQGVEQRAKEQGINVEMFN